MYLSDKPKSAINAMNQCGVSNVFFFSPLFVVRLGQFKKKKFINRLCFPYEAMEF